MRLVQKASQRSAKGTFALDDVILPSSNSVDNITLASLTIHPNPASEYLVANGDCTVVSMTLVDMNGRIVTKASGNVLNVSELPEGNYIAVVSTAAGASSHRVVVKH